MPSARSLAAPPFSLSENTRIEAAVKRAAISIADAAATGRATGLVTNFDERPLNIDGREIGHVSGDKRVSGWRLAMRDRDPRQIVGVLALDQVGPESLERGAHRAVAQHQPVMRAAGNVRRSDRDRDRPLLLDHFVARAGDDHQMAMRRRLQDVAALVQQIGAHAAADFRPALGQVAEQLAARRGGRGRDRAGSLAHPTTHRGKVPSAGLEAPNSVGKLYAMAVAAFPVFDKKRRKFAISSNWHADCYYISRPLGSTPRRGGAAVLWSSCSAPSSFQALASAGAPSSCCSSPLSNISIMMSDPPTNSPFT